MPSDFGDVSPDMDVIDRFLRCAATYRDHPAIVSEGTPTSYRDLLRRARAFAAAFSGRDGPRVLIGLPQVPDAYAAILGAGLAGGYHTPLNLSAPREKLRKIASVLDPNVIVASGDLGRDLHAQAPGAMLIDPLEIGDSEPFDGDGRRHRIAYILFTSGSTGVPKGVVIPRSALNHYVHWLETFNIGPGDRVSQQPNLAFDISMTDIFGALCFGASLHPVLAEGDRLMPARMIAREGITVWNSTPSVVNLMMQARQVTEANLRSVRLFNFCGEPLLPDQLRALFAARPDVAVQNTYGPTEATISMTCQPLAVDTYVAASGASVTLGDPIPGMAIHLVGGAHADEGEIVISGPQLAENYWRDPEKSAQVFKPFVHGTETLRGYFTGDWAERRAGFLFFKERMDFQVKVRGFRIELDEVAAAIRATGWPVACVFKRGEALAAVVERVPGLRFSETALLQALAERIESHAIPETVREIERMPRNDNDKLDRKAAARWLDDVTAPASRRPT